MPPGTPDTSSKQSLRQLEAWIVPVTPFQQNSLLLWCRGMNVATVVDPGGDLPRIEAQIRSRGFSIEQIVLTHGHIDHAGGAAELKAALGVPVIGPHEADKFLLDDLDVQGRSMGMTARPITPDRWLHEGDTITMAGQEFQVLHCPGHSPGSVVFCCPAQRFAVVGDVLFRGSIGRTDFPYGDHTALISAIKTKLLPLGDDVAFTCGHGPGGTFGEERRSNPFLR